MTAPLLFLKNIHLTFGGPPLLDGADISLGEGERSCLVGRNGSGKSTLLKIAAGLVEPDSGERFVQPGSTIRYLAQEPDLVGHDTVLDYVMAGLAPGDDPHRATYLIDRLGLTGAEALTRLSGGEARRCALARALAPQPDILLLDEPTNHLDLPAIEWLESELASLRSALVLISHDRRFLERLTRATVWLDRGITRRRDKGFAAFETWRDTVLAEEERDRHKLDRKIAAENDWLRYGVTARRKRNQGRLRALHKLRQDRRDQRAVTGKVRMTATEGNISGKMVAEAVEVSKSYGGPAIVKDFSFRIQRRDRIGIVGPNGAGKTTLLNLLTGALEPDEGRIRLGATLEMVTLDQRRESLDPSWTLKEALTGGSGDTVLVGGQSKHVIGYMKDFLFGPEQARTPITALSGGERGRLMLARAFARPSNLLVLDEPTNDLDLETLDLLQEMLSEYSGTVLLVSHDRDFLDRVVTSVISWEGDGHWTDYAGGYSDMISQRGSAPPPREVARRPKSTPTNSEIPSPRQPSGAKARLSYKDKHALETLPGQIDDLQAEIARLREILADPGLYASDPATFEAAAASLETAESALGAAEEQWLALELLREDVEGV